MRAKFQCNGVKQVSYEPGKVSCEEVSLSAVYGPEGSTNRAWATATPSGNLTMQINNPKAFGHFKPGQYYFLDFFETDKDG